MEFVLSYQLEVIPNYNGLEDCVYKINFEYKAIDGTFETSDFSSITLELPVQQSFIPFSQLTDSKIREWIFKYYPKNLMEKNLSSRLFVLKNPTTIKDLINPMG